MPATTPEFIFVCCQVGAEGALKQELARQWPSLHLAYSRPGFLTFKMTQTFPAATSDLRSTFARSWGYSLGGLTGETAESLAQQVWQRAVGRDFPIVHVWQRDRGLPGDQGFEPGPTPLATELAQSIGQAAPSPVTPAVNEVARPGQAVLDCVIVEPNQWWIGYHQAHTVASRWPGGVWPHQHAPHAVSRAYYKMHEALSWSEFPIEAGDRVAEIGCAPGGASQALLERDLTVLGIDPAEVDDAVLEHPNFTHVKKRAADMKRREFSEVLWLVADSNVAPAHTLDSVEAIVTHAQVHVRGLLLTLKLPDWKLAAELPVYFERIKSWGFRDVRARQLAFNRREVCVAAMPSRAQHRVRTSPHARG